MKKLIPALLLALLCTPAMARENVPNSYLTPGQIITTDIKFVCMSGFSKAIRRTTGTMKRNTYRAYGVKNVKHNKIDHLVPLSLGGADTMKNLWPSDFHAKSYDAGMKDRLELKIRKLVCAGDIGVRQGQKLFMKDWRIAYDRYCSTYQDCPSYMTYKKAMAN